MRPLFSAAALLLAFCLFPAAAAELLRHQPAEPEYFPPRNEAIPVPAFRHNGGPLTVALDYLPALRHTWLLLDGNLLLIRDASGNEVLKLDLVRRGRFRLKYGKATQISLPLLDEIDRFPLRLVLDGGGARLEMEQRMWAQLPGPALPPGEYSITLARPENGIPGAFGRYRELTVSNTASPPARQPDYPERSAQFARLAEADRRLLADPAYDLNPAVAPAAFDRDNAGRAAIRIALDSLWKRLHIGQTANFDAYLADLEVEAARLAAPHVPAPAIPLTRDRSAGFLTPGDRDFHFGVIGWELGNYAPELALLGCDLVSDSVWPAQLITPEGGFNEEHYRSRTLPSLRRLAHYGIAVDMLVAPYTPPFLLQKHPEWSGSYAEKRMAGHGFLSASIIHPDYRALCRAYLGHLIPRLDRERNVAAICLDNEPGYEDYTPAMQARFRDFLRERYSGIGELNRSWGSAYPDYDAIALTRREALDREKKNRFYDWFLFTSGVGTAHLHFLHDDVKRHTQLPTHVKVLPWEFGHTWVKRDSKERKETELADGIDRFAIAGFTDLLGTDSYADKYSAEGEYAANTMYQSLYYDLVSGYDRRKALFDSEWHIAAIDARTPPEYIEMVMQQNVMHGLRAGTVWVMNPCVDAFDISGDVPLLIRYTQTAATIRKFAGAYRALAERPRPVALLYSPKSRRLFDDRAVHPLQRLHKASLFTGLGIRLLDERQLLAGDLDGIRAIISVDCPAPETGTAEALRNFRRNGGTFARIGEFGGGPVPGELRYETTADQKQLQKILLDVAGRAGISPAIRVGKSDGSPVPGVEFHSVRQQSGSELLYVTNYSTKPQEVTLHGVRRFRNLHSGETGGSRLTLPVLGTLLAAVER